MADNYCECAKAVVPEGNCVHCEGVARAIKAEVPYGYGMTAEESRQYASIAILAERQRCIAICNAWLVSFEGRNPQYVSAQDWANSAIHDIVELIETGVDVQQNSTPNTN